MTRYTAFSFKMRVDGMITSKSGPCERQKVKTVVCTSRRLAFRFATEKHPPLFKTTSACLDASFGRKRPPTISKPFPGAWVEACSVFSLYSSMTPLKVWEDHQRLTTAEHT